MPFSTRKKKILSSAIIFLLVAVGVFGMGRIFGVGTARADNGSVGILDVVLNPDDVALYFAGKLVQGIVWIGGQILAVLMWVLFKVAKYNNFIGSTAVVNGWFIARDVCNIFFVVIFLVMTVATVLGIESYHYSRILTKLLIMVVLINFSKLICGIFIDVAQVIMLTFMNSFGELGSGYLTNILGITQLLEKAKINIKQGMETSFFTHFGSYLLVLIYVVVAIATILVITLVLVQRIIMLWIYVILSPFAYMLSAFPAGASYSSKWWDDFVKYVTIGPIIAFFVWLSFVSLGNVKTQNTFTGLEGEMSEQDIKKETASLGTPKDIGGLPQAGVTEAGSPSHMVKFIFGIAMLIGGLMVAQTIGGMAGSFAGGTIKNLQEGGIGAADWLNRKVAGGWTGKGWNIEQMKAEGKGLGRQLAARAGNLFARGTGQDLNFGRRWAKIKKGMDKNKEADFSRMDRRSDQLMQGRFGAVLGTGSEDWYNQYVQGFLAWKGIRKGVKNVFVPPEKYDESARGASKEIKTLMRQHDNVYTRRELENKEESFNLKKLDLEKQLEDYNNDIKKPLEDLNKTINSLQDSIDNPKLRGGKSLDDLEKDFVKAESEKEKLEAGLAKRQEVLDNHNEEWAGFEKDMVDGIVIGVGTTIEKDTKIKKINEDIGKQQKIYQEESKKFAKYTVMSPEARQARRSGQNKAKSELGTEDSAELITIYQDALNQGKTDKAAAVMKKLAENVDTNEILSALGYNTSIGLTKEEYAKASEKVRAAKKGLHDFIRDTLIAKGGMDEQDAFALESELAEIHKANQQTAYASAVSLVGGKFKQNTQREQEHFAAIDLSKTDPENLIRRGPRFALGGEGIDGKFRVHAAGLNYIMGNYGIIDKNIDNKRVSRWTGLKLTESENMKIMRDAAKTMGTAQRAGYEQFLNKLENYGKLLRGGMGDFSEAVKKTGESIDRSRGI